MKLQKLNKIFLYDEGSTEALNIDEIAEYLRTKLPKVAVEIRGDPFHLWSDRISEYARKIASIKVQDPTKQVQPGYEPLYCEIEHERRRLLGKTKAIGILYDGWELQRIFWELIPRDKRNFDFAHILVTNRLFATWDEPNRRYHARVSVYGIPSIISTTGVVEAPAKPREYYLLRQQYKLLGKDPLELKDKFKGRFIDYEDSRLTEVMKGYAMQAVFFCLIGYPFCEDKGCRLYNAHWQEELIFAQLDSEYEFCPKHAELIGG